MASSNPPMPIVVSSEPSTLGSNLSLARSSSLSLSLVRACLDPTPSSAQHRHVPDIIIDLSRACLLALRWPHRTSLTLPQCVPSRPGTLPLRLGVLRVVPGCHPVLLPIAFVPSPPPSVSLVLCCHVGSNCQGLRNQCGGSLSGLPFEIT